MQEMVLISYDLGDGCEGEIEIPAHEVRRFYNLLFLVASPHISDTEREEIADELAGYLAGEETA